jgi:hypothetical protein
MVGSRIRWTETYRHAFACFSLALLERTPAGQTGRNTTTTMVPRVLGHDPDSALLPEGSTNDVAPRDLASSGLAASGVWWRSGEPFNYKDSALPRPGLDSWRSGFGLPVSLTLFAASVAGQGLVSWRGLRLRKLTVLAESDLVRTLGTSPHTLGHSSHDTP